MTYDFHPEARAEYREASEYYKSRRASLGAVFTREVEGTIQRILEAPNRWRVFEADVRICRTRVFPYAVLYTVQNESILIVAVMHMRREPGYWRQRL